ncbi:MAG: chorismate mutase [Bauldia sp.]
MPAPADCTTKEEIRTEIDRLDGEILELFAERFAYVRRMAEIKSDPADAYDAGRIDHILARVRFGAVSRGLDPDLFEAMWKSMIDWNVAYEERTIGKG